MFIEELFITDKKYKLFRDPAASKWVHTTGPIHTVGLYLTIKLVKLLLRVKMDEP